eukprot:2413885-Amphidinium_carterae.1
MQQYMQPTLEPALPQHLAPLEGIASKQKMQPTTTEVTGNIEESVGDENAQANTVKTLDLLTVTLLEHLTRTLLEQGCNRQAMSALC